MFYKRIRKNVPLTKRQENIQLTTYLPHSINLIFLTNDGRFTKAREYIWGEKPDDILGSTK